MRSDLAIVFSGQYSYKRLISSPQLSSVGTAHFENHANQIMYTEEGRYNAGKQACYQKRVFVIDESNLYIYKNDLSILHEFPLVKRLEFPVTLTHTHLCKNDQYHLEMMIHSCHKFSTFYRIQGPAKDYTIHTTFKRI